MDLFFIFTLYLTRIHFSINLFIYFALIYTYTHYLQILRQYLKTIVLFYVILYVHHPACIAGQFFPLLKLLILYLAVGCPRMGDFLFLYFCIFSVICPQNLTKERRFFPKVLRIKLQKSNHMCIRPAKILDLVSDGIDAHHAHIIKERHVYACIYIPRLFSLCAFGDLIRQMPASPPLLLESYTMRIYLFLVVVHQSQSL